MSWVICDRRIAARVKGKVSKLVVRPAAQFLDGGTDEKTRGRAEDVTILTESDQDGKNDHITRTVQVSSLETKLDRQG